MIKGFTGHNPPYGCLDVGALLNEDRNVARANPQGRSAGTVRGFDHAGATGGKNQVSLFHQLLGAFKGRHGRHADKVFGYLEFLEHLLNDGNRFTDTVCCCRVRAENDTVTGFQRNQGFIDGC